MPQGDPAGYLPSVRRARMQKKRKAHGNKPMSAARGMMGEHDTPQGMNPSRKMARRRAFLG